MAMVDYGAILRVDGKFINKNQGLFMDASDTGYVCETAYENEAYPDVPISGNYYVYAGDEKFLLVFYKGTCKIISNGIVLKTIWWSKFISEEFYLDGLPTVKIEHLDPNLYIKDDWLDEQYKQSWTEYVKENWAGSTGDEKLCELEKGTRHYKWFIKHKKHIARLKKDRLFKTRTSRWKATWEYSGHKYEVIYGYGIDPSEKTWNEIKDKWRFTDIEKGIIDEWFSSDVQ